MKAGAPTSISSHLEPAFPQARMSNGDASTVKNKLHDFALIITQKVQQRDTPSLKSAPKPNPLSRSPDPILLSTQSSSNGTAEVLGISQMSSGKPSASLTGSEGLNGDTERSIVKNNKARKGASGKGRESFTLEVPSKTKLSRQKLQKVNGVSGLSMGQSQQQRTPLDNGLNPATSTSGPEVQLSSHLNPSSSSSSFFISLPSILGSVGNSHLVSKLSSTLSPKETPPQHPLAATPRTSPSSSKLHPTAVSNPPFSLEFIKSKPNDHLSKKALGKQALRLSEDRREGEGKESGAEIIEETVTESADDDTVTTTLSATTAVSIVRVKGPNGLSQKSDQLAVPTVKCKIGRPLKSDHDLKRPRRKKKIRLEEPVFTGDSLRAKLLKGIIVDRPPPLPPSLYAHNVNYLPYSLIPRVFPSLRINKQLPQQIEDSSSPPPPPISSPVSIQHLSPAKYLASAIHRRTNRLFTQAPLPCATALPASLSSNLIQKHKRTLSNPTASPEELDREARLRGWASSFRELIPLSFEEEFEESDSDECNPLDLERRSTCMPGSVPLKNVRWTLHGTDVGAGWVRNGGNFPGGVGRWGAADWRPNKTEDEESEGGEGDIDSQVDEEMTEDEREDVEKIRSRLQEKQEGGSDASHRNTTEDIQMTELSSDPVDYDSSEED